MTIDRYEPAYPRKTADCAGLIYATQLPDNVIKIGFATKASRALAAQTYHIEDVRVLGIWEVPLKNAAEQKALAACAQWRVRGELFRAQPVDWLDISNPIMDTLERVLGPPKVTSFALRKTRGRPAIGE